MKGWRQKMSQSAPKPTELQQLQQEYAKKVQIYGDVMYRITCFQNDASKLVEELRAINEKAAELSAKPKLEDLPQMTEEEMAAPDSAPVVQ